MEFLTCRPVNVATGELPHASHELSETTDEQAHANNRSVTIDATSTDHVEGPQEDSDGEGPHSTARIMDQKLATRRRMVRCSRRTWVGNASEVALVRDWVVSLRSISMCGRHGAVGAKGTSFRAVVLGSGFRGRHF